jgi:hypothetical protein
MKFLYAMEGCPGFGHIRNERIVEESGVKLILTQIMPYGKNWGGGDIYKEWKSIHFQQ